MKSFIHTQPVLVFLRKMRPDSLQTWQIILFDVNLCRKKCLPQRNTHSSLFLCLSFWKQHMRFRQYVTPPPSSSRGKCILRFGLSDFFFHSTLASIYLFIYNKITLLSMHLSAPLHRDRISKHFMVSTISDYPGGRQNSSSTVNSFLAFALLLQNGSGTW